MNSTSHGLSQTDVAASKAIERNYERISLLPPDSLRQDAAHDMVVQDIESLTAVCDKNERFFVAATMGENVRMQASYKAELQRQSPEVYAETEAAYAENQRRVSAKAERKSAEWHAVQSSMNYAVLTITNSNTAAFHDIGRFVEIGRVLSTAANRVANGESSFLLRDTNGNEVGSFEIVPELPVETIGVACGANGRVRLEIDLGSPAFANGREPLLAKLIERASERVAAAQNDMDFTVALDDGSVVGSLTINNLPAAALEMRETHAANDSLSP
jgi:hypothetical protein